MFLSGIVPPDARKDEFRADVVAKHVHKAQEVWVFEIDRVKGPFVQQSHSDVVRGPYQ
jgi:hypothetical protein